MKKIMMLSAFALLGGCHRHLHVAAVGNVLPYIAVMVVGAVSFVVIKLHKNNVKNRCV